MSETLTQVHKENALSAEEVEQPEPSGELDHTPDFVQPLVDLVNGNSEEVRAWPWLGGTSDRLGSSVWRHPLAQDYLKPNEVPILMADILSGLAKLPETEQLEEEVEEVNALAAETDEKDSANNLVKFEDQNKSTMQVEEVVKVDATPEPPEPTNSAQVETHITNGNQSARAEPVRVTKPVTTSSSTKQSLDVLHASDNVQSSEAYSSSGNSSNETGPQKTTLAEATVSPVQKVEVNESKQAHESIDTGSTVQLKKESEAKDKLKSNTREQPATEKPDVETREDIQLEPASQEVNYQTTAEHELDSVDVVASEASIETGPLESDGELEVVEGGLLQEIHSYHIDTEGMIDFIEGEDVRLEDFDSIESMNNDSLYLGLEEGIELGKVFELSTTEQKPVANAEHSHQTSGGIDEIEVTLLKLSETISTQEAEATVEITNILDKITSLSLRFESNPDEQSSTEIEIQTELEVLFSELFVTVGIDYTPELIESLAKLTLHWQMRVEIEKLYEKKSAEDLAPTSATHEIINKILAVLSAIKKSITHAGAIGKSALQLYKFSFAAA